MQQALLFPVGYQCGRFVSQFPLWDFGECNCFHVEFGGDVDVFNSQFPLWDFGECNRIFIRIAMMFSYLSLNSLCGISVNVT